MNHRDLETAYRVLENDGAEGDQLAELGAAMDLLTNLGLRGDTVDGLHRAVRALELLTESVADATQGRADKRLAGILRVLREEIERAHL